MKSARRLRDRSKLRISKDIKNSIVSVRLCIHNFSFFLKVYKNMLESLVLFLFFIQKDATKYILVSFYILAKISAICISVFSLRPVYRLQFHSREVSIHMDNMHVLCIVYSMYKYLYCSCVPQTLLSSYRSEAVWLNDFKFVVHMYFSFTYQIQIAA